MAGKGTANVGPGEFELPDGGGETADRRGGKRRARLPLDARMLEEMALAYVARYATTARKLGDYCRRKLRERGWQEDASPPDVDALVARFIEARYVDDAEFARSKASGLLRRGYGARRIAQKLGAAGVSEEGRVAIDLAEARSAALAMARKRGFGPFGRDEAPPADPARRQKQIAAMLRAGHDLDSARVLVEAEDEQAACDWADAARQEEH